SSSSRLSRALHSFPTRRSSDLLFLRQQRRRGDRGGDADRQAVHREERVRRPRAVVPWTHRGHPERHRQLESQEEGWTRCVHGTTDRKSTRLNSSHVAISYAVFC